MVRIFYLAKASILTAKRYKIDWFGYVLMPIVSVIPVLIAVWYGNLIGSFDFSSIVGSGNFFGYYFIGLTYWNYIESMWSSIFALRQQMRIGQLEDVLLSPIKPWEYIFGWSFLALCITTVNSLPLIIIAFILNILMISLWSLVVSIIVFLMSMIASYGFAFMIFGLTLVLREGDEIVSLMGNSAPLLGGLYFPVKILPTPLLTVSYVFPFTWGLDLLRASILHTKTIIDFNVEFLVLICLSVMYFLLGLISYKLLERRMRIRGIQGF